MSVLTYEGETARHMPRRHREITDVHLRLTVFLDLG